MWQSHEFKTAYPIGLGASFYHPPSSSQEAVHSVCYCNPQNQIQYLKQYEPEIQLSATKHRITALEFVQIGGGAYLALGTTDVSQASHLQVFDVSQNRLVFTKEVQSPISVIRQTGEDVLLYACEDYVFGERMAAGKSSLSLQELFWSVSAKVVDIIPVTNDGQDKEQTLYCVVSSDLYIRLFQNESLLDEQRLFTKTRVRAAKGFGGFVGILSESSKFKLYFVRDQGLALLVNQEVPEQTQDFTLAFKPYARNLGGDGDLLEKIVGIDAPLPFLILQGPGEAVLNVFNLEGAALVLKRLLKLNGGSAVNTFVSENVLFDVFYRQYREGFRLESEELPFISSQVQESCRQFIVVQQEKTVRVLEFPILFDFTYIIQAFSEQEGSLVPSGAKAAGNQSEQEQTKGRGAHKKVKKVRKTVQDSQSFFDVIRLQAELLGLQNTESGASGEGEDTREACVAIQRNKIAAQSPWSIDAYVCLFDGRPTLFDCLERKQQLSFTDGLQLSATADTVATAGMRKGQLDLREFQALPRQQKHAFRAAETVFSMPLTTHATTNKVSYILRNEQTNRKICVLEEMKTCVLPAYSVEEFGPQPVRTAAQSEIAFQAISLQRFKLLFQLQNIKCQLSPEFSSFRIATTLDPQLHRYQGAPDDVSQSISVLYDEKQQTLQLWGDCFRAVLNLAAVCYKVMQAQSPPSVLIGGIQETAFEQQLSLLQSMQAQAVDTHGNLRASGQMQAYAVADAVNAVSQKRFDGVFGMYAGALQKGFADASILSGIQAQLAHIRENLDELLELYSQFNKEAALRARGVLKAGQGFAAAWQ